MIGASANVTAAGAYHGLGKSFPGVTTPFGMVQVSPNTITGGDNVSGYSDEHKTIEGFAMTQLSGTGWYGDLGNSERWLGKRVILIYRVIAHIMIKQQK